LELLTILAARHTDWIRMARSFGADQELAQDIVQEMYVRLYKYVEDAEKIMYNEKEVNTFFVYVTLRNMYTSLMKAKSRFEFVDVSTLEDELVFEEANIEAETELQSLYEEIWETADDWHWYDKKIFHLYHNTDMSIRTLRMKPKSQHVQFSIP
jgi:DNA-directed RNA polymerase specialized sigma24 family protein